MDKNLNNFYEKESYKGCQNVYHSLFKDISTALAILHKKDTVSINKAIKLLEKAQYKAKEFIVDTEHIVHDNSLYTDIFKRTNLQNIGYFLKEGSHSMTKNSTSFTQREYIAEKELEDELKKILNEEIITKAYPSIVKYASTKEEIQFSLGMKIGAKLTLLLTSDSEYDF